jgi:lauroyl/myristoyl acyltransferase
MDTFVDDAAHGFSGTQKGLNPAAVRLAAVTGTPLVPIWPTYERGVLRFDMGTPIVASTCRQRQDEALRLALQFFENAVRCDPAGWRRVLSFLEWR